MSNPTSNFNWQMPTATDLVTDLPADFEVFGQAVDSSMADLLGGTTGQILAKNSNTNMDFVWTTPNPGDITGVTAGTGISGGGTSGDVTITNSMATEITAKGDLIVGTGNAAFDNLPAGTNGHVLTADSTVSPTGLKWAAPAGGGGKVLQVVQGTTTTQSSNSTNVFADTGLTATITPSAATSKILVIVMQGGTQKNNANATNELLIKLMRGATQIGNTVYGLYTNTTVINGGVPLIYQLLDEPNTTSATTYKTQYANNFNGALVFVQAADSQSTMILMEIGA
jgi:hypothetical protein